MTFVTLLSDLGLRDATVAKAKGILGIHLGNTNIIDITHETEPYYHQQAAYHLAATLQSFPTSSIHVVLFDVYYNANPVFLLAEVNGQFIIVPDNGVLPLAVNTADMNIWKAFEVSSGKVFTDIITDIAKTITIITNTEYKTALPPYNTAYEPLQAKPIVTSDSIQVQVIHIDRFENVILNIRREEFEAARKNRSFTLRFMRDDKIDTMSDHYNSVKEGYKLCRFNSTGYLEIAVNKGKAASLFGFRLAGNQQQIYNTVKIQFE